MPINDLINLHFTAAEITAVNGALTTLQNALAPKCRNLTPEERQQYGSIGERNKLFVHKVRDYRIAQSAMSSPDVDWVEFEADYSDRNFLESTLARLALITEMASDTKILHDFDVYQSALTDYDYTKYKMTTNTSGYDAKHEDMKQFFQGGGTTKQSLPEDQPT